MRQKSQCKACRRMFTPSPRRPDQKYCSQKQCQKARRRDWQREKLKTDKRYRQAQQAAKDAWRARNPRYWANYRQGHPEYVQRNREQQRARNARRRIAKMDESEPQSFFESGAYRIIPVQGKFANMDEILVIIQKVSAGCG